MDAYAWQSHINYRRYPELYRVGKGEQGVLICEPYKSELLPHWRFKTPALARMSADYIYSCFLDYLARNDFVGADMARKYLQMGFTRSRRYANYKGGKKYAADKSQYLRGSGEPEKAVSAEIFYDKWQQAEENEKYAELKLMWKDVYG